jgi:cell division protein FtsA
MQASQLVVACDFGTTAFRALVSEAQPGGGIKILGCGEIPAAGFQDGDFVDMSAGSRGIARTMRLVEAAADVDVSAFYYNIAGSHLRSVWARGQIQIGPGPRTIEKPDLEAVLAKARSLAVPFDSWILAVNPVEYAVDRKDKIVDPRGRIGSLLEVEAHLITGSRSVVHNIEHAIRMAGYEVAGRAVDILATAKALLVPDEQKEGVLLIDVGGHATQWVLFRNDRIIGNGAVPWGGHHLTSDLSHGLRVSLEAAEQIKRERGVVLRSLVDEVSPEVLFEEERPEESVSLLAAVMEPRLEEIFGLVKQDLGDPNQLATLGAGVVLTGGGSRCRGSSRLCEEVFALPTQRRFLPPDLEGAQHLGQGQWATAVGLTIWSINNLQTMSEARRTPLPNPRPFWRRLRGWLERPQSERGRMAVGD